MRLDQVIRTSHRKKEALSPGQQRRIGEEFERRTGHQIVMTHDSGRSESGKTMDREALHTVRQRVRDGETDGAFVAYLDRLGRAPIGESTGFAHDLTVVDGGVLFAADWSDEPIDLTNPDVEDMFVFRMQMNRSMWNKAAARQKTNKRDSLALGMFIGPCPFGYYKNGGRDPHSRAIPFDPALPKGRLLPHPRWGPVVTEAFNRAAHDGVDATRRYLELAAPDERIWRMDMVRKLLKNRTYLGEHGRGGAEGYKPHTPLTDRDTYELAQHDARPRRQNESYPLSGLIRCACGGHLVGQWNHDEHRYRCQPGQDATCNAAELIEYVREEIRDAVGRAEIRERVAPAGLDKLHDDWRLAAAELDAFMDATSPLAGNYAKHLLRFETAAADAERKYRAARAQARAVERFPAAAELDDDDELRRALRMLDSVGLALALSPGRLGRPALADRIVWVDDLEDVARPLAS